MQLAAVAFPRLCLLEELSWEGMSTPVPLTAFPSALCPARKDGFIEIEIF